MTEPDGDTAKLLGDLRCGMIVRLNSAKEIATRLIEFMRRIEQGDSPVADGAAIDALSRGKRARELAALFSSTASASLD